MKFRLLSIVLLTVLSVSCGKKTPTLNLLVWEGYADPSFMKAFEEQNHCKVSASYMGSSDELVAKLRGGSAGNYDVISPSSDVATMISEGGMATPLDLAKLAAYTQLSPKLRAMPLVRVNGNVYGVPFMWGPNPAHLRHQSFRGSSRELGCDVGPETERKDFRLGRSLH